MSTPRKRRREGDTETRDQLIEATADIMLEEGYAAATSRRVAAKAGVNPALVYYYFPTMDELFLAVFRRGAEANLERQRKALAAGDPMRALWEVATEPRGAAMLMEFMALANHRKEIRAEFATYAERYRESQVAALTVIMRGHGIDLDALPPTLMSVMISSLGATLVNESSLGITLGHRELVEFAEDFVRAFEGAPWSRAVGLPSGPRAITAETDPAHTE
ncbi:TetR/AcrR family transcriptional regulator [Nocardia sp. alder85J]|uniref:TetR/AcrR family transcriptional regulator n=1 Tax=Nocardia sp. alder85J TaxID=2862949 RepID=UPI001CD6596A|nr:TetR/AcrR family transcriptional regulator [Nocardia sp. alder85J]MCX4090815.1 TetR/AcrR family transcriptional regulator [Nocardia sp. alder85J]